MSAPVKSVQGTIVQGYIWLRSEPEDHLLWLVILTSTSTVPSHDVGNWIKITGLLYATDRFISVHGRWRSESARNQYIRDKGHSCYLCLELLEFRIMNCMQLLNMFLSYAFTVWTLWAWTCHRKMCCVVCYGLEGISGNVFLLWRTMNVMNWESKRNDFLVWMRLLC